MRERVHVFHKTDSDAHTVERGRVAWTGPRTRRYPSLWQPQKIIQNEAIAREAVLWYHIPMPRPCLTCTHPRHFEVNRDLIAGDTTAAVSARYGIALATLQRHRNNCLAPGIKIIAAGKRNTQAALAIAALPTRQELGSSYMALTHRIDGIIAAAERQGSLAVAIQGLNSLRQTLDSIAHLAGHDTPTVAVQINTAPVDTSVFVAALVAASPDAESRLRFAQAMATRPIDGTPATAPDTVLSANPPLDHSHAN